MLSIVAIGKNEAANMPCLIASIEALKDYCSFPIETIYIDSCSSDGSVQLAADYFDKVSEIMDDANVCASSGRYVGTLEATHPWVFYIDSDMEICNEFFPLISAIPELPDECCGLVGIYAHRFDDGTMAYQTFDGGVIKSEWAAAFGGAVILRRESVLGAGNWSPGVYGKEEMELYARLGSGQRVVRFFGVPMINHYSEAYSRMQLLKRLLYPSAGLGKVFYGYGQSIRSLLIAGKLGALIRLDSEPYLFWAFLLVGFIVAALLPVEWALLLLSLEIVILSLWMRPGSVVRYLTLPLSLFSGWTRYLPYFRPSIKRWSSSTNKAA